MVNDYFAVIMAGGEGSRLWPLSRHGRPKQMVRLGSERSLFQISIDRLKDIIPPERMLVVTVASQAEELMRQGAEIPPENFLIEPLPRGTASVVGLGALAVRARNPKGIMAVVTADQLIQNTDAFHRLFQDGYQLAQDGYMVTLGIRPTFPATGYGYIQRGEALPEYDFLAFRVQQFREKPNEDTARNFLLRGDHDWNAGMFIWRVERILEEFSRQMPELTEKLDFIARAWGTSEQNTAIQAVWPTIQAQTIDYGIMEKAKDVVVLPAVDLGWNDVGSWESLFDVLPADEHGNIILDATHIGIDTENSLIVSDTDQRLLVTLGVKDLVIVDTQDAVLVCSRDASQKVRDVVRLLKQNEATRHYL